MIDRVDFRTRAIGDWTNRLSKKESWGRATKAAVRAFVAMTALTNEIAHEFESGDERRPLSTDRLARMDPDRRRSFDATRRMMDVIRERAPKQRGTQLAVTAAARVVQVPGIFTLEQAVELYSVLEPEIPFDELDHAQPMAESLLDSDG